MSHFIGGLLSSLFFFAVAGVLMPQALRGMAIARPLAVFFVAEGAWTLVAGILLWIHSTTAPVMLWIHFMLFALCAAYLLYELYRINRQKRDGATPPPAARDNTNDKENEQS